MATATANIPYGSILSQLRARQQQEWQIKEEKKKKKAAFTNQLVQLGGMAVGGALAGPLGMGVMAGVGAGGLAGGLAGNAMTGTPVSMNQGIGAAMQVGGLMEGQARTGQMAERTANNLAMDEAKLTDMGWTKTMGTGNMQGGISLGDAQYMPPVTENWQDRMAEATRLGYDSKYVEKSGAGAFTVQSPKSDTINITGSGGPGPQTEGSAAVRQGSGQYTSPGLGGSPTTIRGVSQEGRALDNYRLSTEGIPRGTIRGGYEFMGGDPNDPKSWLQI